MSLLIKLFWLLFIQLLLLLLLCLLLFIDLQTIFATKICMLWTKNHLKAIDLSRYFFLWRNLSIFANKSPKNIIWKFLIKTLLFSTDLHRAFIFSGNFLLYSIKKSAKQKILSSPFNDLSSRHLSDDNQYQN